MKKIILICLLIFPSICFGKWGAGLAIGTHTGLSGSYYLSEKNSIDAHLALNSRNYQLLYIHGTYLWHFSNQVKNQKFSLNWYTGVGGTLEVFDIGYYGSGSTFMGVRGPIGVKYLFEKTPVEIFIEGALNVLIIPVMEAQLSGFLGVRYYFDL